MPITYPVAYILEISQMIKKFGPERELTEKDGFLFTMMKLRLGSTNADLAQRFAVSATTVTNIFTTWVKLLASELGCLIYKPSYEVFRKTLPKKFHKPGYSKVRRLRVAFRKYRPTVGTS